MGSILVLASQATSPTRFPYGLVTNPVAAAGAADVIPVQSCEVYVTSAGVDAMTLALPKAGVYPPVPQSIGDPRDDGKTIIVTDVGGHAHTITTPAAGINGADHIATFGGSKGDSITLKAFGGVWYAIALNGVTLS